ncbi:MAG: hypothetical protein L6Q54_11640 [Leptospiraceae bacterium]|nr:hypothetical protein [Leptospiraceae bacterium]
MSGIIESDKKEDSKKDSKKSPEKIDKTDVMPIVTGYNKVELKFTL